MEIPCSNKLSEIKPYCEGRTIKKFYDYDRSFVVVFENGTSLQINYDNGDFSSSGSFWINDKDNTDRILNNIKERAKALA